MALWKSIFAEISPITHPVQGLYISLTFFGVLRQKKSNWCANPVLTYKIALLSLQVKGQQVKSGLRYLRSTIFFVVSC